MAGEFGAEVDRAGALHVGQLGAAELDELRRQRSGSRLVGGHLDGLHHGFDLFTEVLVRDTEYGDVDHLGVGDQDVLGFLRIDVHSTGDDHVCLAVGEVQEPVGVDVADVAECGPALCVPRRSGLLGVVVVLELGCALEVHGAGLALGNLVAVLADDVQDTDDRLTDGALVGEPALAVAVHEPVAFAAGVVLVDHGAQPLDHLLLDRCRARCSSVDDGFERRDVVLLSGLLGQLEHAHEHRRHHLAVGDVVVVDERQVLLGVEVLHRHDGGADRVHGEAEPQWGSVVEGSGREVALGVVHPEQQLQETLHGAG